MADTNENSNFDPSARPTYSPAQLAAYFERIKHPARNHSFSIIANSAPPRTRSSVESLRFLTQLIKYQLCNIPFENLDLHYSSNKHVCLDHDHIFDKIIGSGRGRGGWCFETNLLFATVLRTLKYDVFSTGARVNEAVQPIADEKGWKGPKYSGWSEAAPINSTLRSRF